jgi:hypothetical protein
MSHADTDDGSSFDTDHSCPIAVDAGASNIIAKGGAPSNINATPSASSTQTRTRTCIVRPPERHQQTVAFMAQPCDNMWEIQDYEIQTAMANPIAFAASLNPDIIYLHKALKARVH